ncbi:CHAP domain-containing protein [Tuanshanicoccus lijuaniae]|uniref:CHAP domain-containing protein n=1 Tax=Aerococcaceae bacterium zg-1292 TaxID=2774330 RepID=UPI001937E0F1|nr:CHAP domain-containing protein [Aerococcaceae bacterium zg-1292]QQA38063.1 CHAP domain-containing protein [Aerococcaceae bacterium zg-1292]
MLEKVLFIANQYVGAPKYGTAHKELVDTYNAARPLPQGYRVTYDDDWCDVFVSSVFIKAGVSKLIGRECGVQRHIQLFKQLGIWLGETKPQRGDIITFDWDRGGFADHIGIVEDVSGDTVKTIEGNSNGKVSRNHFKWNDARIVGYARPKYKQQTMNKPSIDILVKEVLAGKHGVGEERKHSLGINYDAVQKKVNEILSKPDEIALTYRSETLRKYHLDLILKLCKQYQIIPSFAITVLHFEGMWGHSFVGRSDNNWGGMTWTGSVKRPSGVVVSKGSARPQSEGGHYIRYQSVEDFLIDWFYLLRQGGSYRVSGQKTFRESVQGLFQIGGATYNYAATPYETYLIRVVSRKTSIESETGISLERWDPKELKNYKESTTVIEDDYEIVVNGVKYVLVKQ